VHTIMSNISPGGVGGGGGKLFSGGEKRAQLTVRAGQM